MASSPEQTITVTINGVPYSVDMNRIKDLYARIMAGPGDTLGEKLAMAMTQNPLVSAEKNDPPDPENRRDYDPASD